MYDFIDMSTVVKTIATMKDYSLAQAEDIMSIMSTWGSKFNMIIGSISTGVIVSLIPTLTESFIKKNQLIHKLKTRLEIQFCLLTGCKLNLKKKPIQK